MNDTKKLLAFLYWLDMMNGAKNVTIAKSATTPDMEDLFHFKGSLHGHYMGVHINVIPDYGN